MTWEKKGAEFPEKMRYTQRLGRCASCVITLRRVRVDTSTSGALVPVYEVIAVALTKGTR